MIHAANRDAKYGSSLSMLTSVMSLSVPNQLVFKASKLLRKLSVSLTNMSNLVTLYGNGSVSKTKGWTVPDESHIRGDQCNVSK